MNCQEEKKTRRNKTKQDGLIELADYVFGKGGWKACLGLSANAIISLSVQVHFFGIVWGGGEGSWDSSFWFCRHSFLLLNFSRHYSLVFIILFSLLFVGGGKEGGSVRNSLRLSKDSRDSYGSLGISSFPFVYSYKNSFQDIGVRACLYV